MKRNKSKGDLSDFVSTTVVEKTCNNKTVESILLALKEKYYLSNNEKRIISLT